MFNWLFRKTQIEEDSYKIAILDRETDFRNLYYKLAIFYHSLLYSKLIKIIESIYGGYSGDIFHFLPPHDNLEDLYQRIRYSFMQIDRRPDFRELKIIDFKVIPSLFENHHRLIKNWEEFKKTYLKDKKTLTKSVIQQYPLSNDVQVAFYDIDKLIKQHNKAKKAFLHPSNKNVYKICDIIIDTNKGVLIYNSISKNITLESKEFKFLLKLLQNKGVIVRNKIMAEYLKWKPMDHETDKDFSQKLKDLKQTLGDKLLSLSLPKKEIKSIKDKIVSNRNYGYKLI